MCIYSSAAIDALVYIELIILTVIKFLSLTCIRPVMYSYEMDDVDKWFAGHNTSGCVHRTATCVYSHRP